MDTKLEEYEQNGWPMDENAVNYLFGEMVEGGADTTANHLLTLILALAAHPEVQNRAYQELEAVCGAGRAPLLSDFDKCPYINCIVKEGMRWRPTYVSLRPCQIYRVRLKRPQCSDWVASFSYTRYDLKVLSDCRKLLTPEIDDVYDDYLIPKGSTVFMSIWSIHQNDSIYNDAWRFNPDRYLGHPKFANEYATSADYENRGESMFSLH